MRETWSSRCWNAPERGRAAPTPLPRMGMPGQRYPTLDAAAPARAAPSVWRDPVVPATLAAVLCLWVLKLVQQGYVDGVNPILLSCLHACASVFHHSSSSTANSSLQAGAFL